MPFPDGEPPPTPTDEQRMTKPASRRLFSVTIAAVVAATALLYACRDQSAEPGAPDAAAAARGRGKFTLSLQASGSTASGSLATNRGGVDCVITYSIGVVATTGTCSKDYAADMVVGRPAPRRRAGSLDGMRRAGHRQPPVLPGDDERRPRRDGRVLGAAEQL